VDEDDHIDTHVVDAGTDEEATPTILHRAHQDHGQLLPLYLQYEPFIQEAAFPSSSRKINSLDIKSKASLQTC
jgi:hypothetical protein